MHATWCAVAPRVQILPLSAPPAARLRAPAADPVVAGGACRVGLAWACCGRGLSCRPCLGRAQHQRHQRRSRRRPPEGGRFFLGRGGGVWPTPGGLFSPGPPPDQPAKKGHGRPWLATMDQGWPWLPSLAMANMPATAMATNGNFTITLGFPTKYRANLFTILQCKCCGLSITRERVWVACWISIRSAPK